jgi:hypothetical protein
MDVSQLPGTIHQLWDFLWPPIVKLFLLALIGYFIAREAFISIFRRLPFSSPALLQERAAQKTLEAYGLAKLLPLFSLFCIVFILYISQAAVISVGQLLPGTITYQPDKLFSKHTEPETIACLSANLSKIPAEHVRSAIVAKLNQYTEEQKRNLQVLSNIETWKKHGDSAYLGFVSVKSFMVWSVLCAFLAIIYTKRLGKPLIRLTLCLLVLVMFGFLFMANFLYALEQQEYALESAARVLFPLDQSLCNSTRSPGLTEYLERNSRDKSWWHFQLWDSHYFRWVLNTFS